MQVKNGFEDTTEEARLKYFLRVLMLTVRFDSGLTFGELVAKEETKQLWAEYAAQEPPAGEPKYR